MRKSSFQPKIWNSHYKVEKDGYETVTGSKTVVINKASGKITLSATSGTLSTGATGSFTISSNLSGGALSVKSSDTSVVSVSISGSKVTINAGSTAGTATITVTSASTTNYNAATATYTVTVKSVSSVATAILYSDGTFVFQMTDEVDSSHGTVVATYPGVYDSSNSNSGWMTKTYTSSSRAPWNSNNSKIKKVVIEDGVAPISTAYWFNGHTSLTSATIGDSVTNIGKDAFANCSSLTSLTIGRGVTNIANRAFYNLTALTHLYFNAAAVNDFTSSSNYVFYNAGTAGNGVSVVFGAQVTNVPAFLFNPYGMNYIPKITSVHFSGTSCSSIGENAFYGCDYLTTITIPSGVKTIGQMAFTGGGLTTVTISSTVTSIGRYAFNGCSDLSSVTFEDTTTWYVTTTDGATSGGTQVTLTSASTAATYLTSKHASKYWYKSDTPT